MCIRHLQPLSIPLHPKTINTQRIAVCVNCKSTTWKAQTTLRRLPHDTPQNSHIFRRILSPYDLRLRIEDSIERLVAINKCHFAQEDEIMRQPQYDDLLHLCDPLVTKTLKFSAIVVNCLLFWN
uniref:Uncharacterized protein n=1 Tax=Physcomitrium patens TaxID=3218 RepID=A0A2K1KI29_PHYPA|nr:hypothetical protein PHYPA_007088 [Physcomitrium patens]